MDLSALVAFDDTPSFELAVAYDAALVAHAPPVKIAVQVRVPSGTPPDDVVHIASSTSGWVHQPLVRALGSDVATGSLEVARGTWTVARVTRRSWSSVATSSSGADILSRVVLACPGARVTVNVIRWADRSG